MPVVKQVGSKQIKSMKVSRRQRIEAKYSAPKSNVKSPRLIPDLSIKEISFIRLVA